MNTRPLSDQHLLDEIIRRIVQVAAPERIMLFGSSARGTARIDSDFDLLVIKSGRYHRGELTERIYVNLIGTGRAVDIIVATPEDVERFRDRPEVIIAPALNEGRIVYAA